MSRAGGSVTTDASHSRTSCRLLRILSTRSGSVKDKLNSGFPPVGPLGSAILQLLLTI